MALRQLSISVYFVTAVLKHAVAQGLEPAELLRRNRISPRLLKESDARISIERYADLPTTVNDLNDLNSSMNSAYVDETRRFMWKDGEPAFNFGKLKGKPLRWAAGDPEHRGYLRRLLQGTLEGEAHDIVVDALNGKIRRKG